MDEHLRERLQYLAQDRDRGMWERLSYLTSRAVYRVLPFGDLFDTWVNQYGESRDLDEALSLLASCLLEMPSGDAPEEVMARVESSLQHYLETFEGLFSEHLDLGRELHEDILNVLRELAPPPTASSATLFLVSGPSSVGKDAITRHVLLLLRARGFPCHYLLKYTTRAPRPGELEHDLCYHKYVSDNEFVSLVDDDEIILPYGKYRNRYGFSRTQLEEYTLEKIAALSIISDFPNVESITHELRGRGIRVLPVLIHAPADDCRRRMWLRNLDPAELQIRMREMEADCAFVESNIDRLRHIYTMMFDNSDNISFNETCTNVFRVVVDCLLTNSETVFSSSGSTSS